MTLLNVKVTNEDDFVATVKLEKLNKDEEPIERSIKTCVSLSNVLDSVSKGELRLGAIEVNLDFDEEGELVQIEIYN